MSTPAFMAAFAFVVLVLLILVGAILHEANKRDR